MTLPTGTISMSQVAAELGISQSGLSLDHSWVRQLAGQNSGPVSMSNLHGQTAQPNWNANPGSGPGLGFSVSVPFFGGVTSFIGTNTRTPIPDLFINFSSAPNWTGNILLKNNTTGGSSTLSKIDNLTWKLAFNFGPFRANTTDNYSLFPST